MSHETLIVDITISESEVSITHTLYGLELSLRGGHLPSCPGAPGFPVRPIDVAIPRGSVAKSVAGRATSTKTLIYYPAFVAPIRKPGIGSSHHSSTSFMPTEWVEPNGMLYEETIDDMRSRLAWLISTRVDGVLSFACVAIRPVRYDSAGCLELVTQASITIALEAENEIHPRILISERRPSWALSRLSDSQRVINPDVVEEVAKTIVTARECKATVWGLEHDEEAYPASTPYNKDSDLPGKHPSLPGEAVTPYDHSKLNVPRLVDYLIITDDNEWDPSTINTKGSAGSMRTSFTRLAEWKESRGLRAHVASVVDIVNGNYGNFSSGARDLQEVIRNFLKDFISRHDTRFVLLGGAGNIIPIRLACASINYGLLDFSTISTLEANQIVWKGTFLGMRVHSKDLGRPHTYWIGDPNNDHLTVFSTGQIIPYDSGGPSGSLSPRWYHTTDDSFSTYSAVPTVYIRVDGDPDVVNNKLQWYTYINMVPSDLYYSSIFSPSYSQPGKHDWDVLGNGLYGQWSDTTNLDGIDYCADVYLGRAPVRNSNEAGIFVSKVIEYEKSPERPSEYHRYNRVVLAAEPWVTTHLIIRETGDPLPPSENRYAYNSTSRQALLHSAEASNGLEFTLVCYLSESSYRILPYSTRPDRDVHGWYFSTSWDNNDPSEVSFPLPYLVHAIPKPTEWIVVFSKDTSELTPMFFLLDRPGLDGSILEQESIKSMLASNIPSVSHVRTLYFPDIDLQAVAAPIATPTGHAGNDEQNEVITLVGPKTLSGSNLCAELNEGPHLLSMSGHGWFGGCCKFDANVLASLTNGTKTFIVYADSCFTNEFNLDDVISRLSLIAPNGGAVGYIGYSRLSWQGTGKIFLEDFIQGFCRFGRQHLGSLCYTGIVVLNHINDAYFRWSGLAINLMGDPEMPVFHDAADLRMKFVANKRTKELHKRDCPWVEAMWIGNKLYLEEIQWALSNGYDGCAFCLKQYHTH